MKVSAPHNQTSKNPTVLAIIVDDLSDQSPLSQKGRTKSMITNLVLQTLKEYSLRVHQSHADCFVVDFSGLSRLYRKGFYTVSESIVDRLQDIWGLRVRWSLGCNGTWARVQAMNGLYDPVQNAEDKMDLLKQTSFLSFMNFAEGAQKVATTLFDFLCLEPQKVRREFGLQAMCSWYELQGLPIQNHDLQKSRSSRFTSLWSKTSLQKITSDLFARTELSLQKRTASKRTKRPISFVPAFVS